MARARHPEREGRERGAAAPYPPAPPPAPPFRPGARVRPPGGRPPPPALPEPLEATAPESPVLGSGTTWGWPRLPGSASPA